MTHFDLDHILRKASSRINLDVSECEYLLSIPEGSPESKRIIQAAESFIMGSTKGIGSIGVQLGTIIGPCYADCAFCSFASSTTDMEDYTMDVPTLSRYLNAFRDSGIVKSISLMTIHDFSMEALLDQVKVTRAILSDNVELCINTGDLDLAECESLRDAGVVSAYHALRLGESIDNQLEPRDRYNTLRNLVDSGIKLYSGIEPIGPEHTNHEIAELYYRLYELGCYQVSASARVSVAGTRMHSALTISPDRLQHIRSCLMLALTDVPGRDSFYGGYYGGFNKSFAEYSSSPKDINEFTEHNLGHTIQWAAEDLCSRGYLTLQTPRGVINNPYANH